MDAEEKLFEAIEDEERPEVEDEENEMPMGGHQRLQRRNKAVIDKFLGKGRMMHSAVIFPEYYGELLTWALQCYIEKEEWEVIRTLKYRAPEPVYIDVGTDYDRCENLLMNGQLIVEKDDIHLIITVDLYNPFRCGNSVQVEGTARRKKEVEAFTDGVKSIAKEQNFYRGKKVEFSRHPRLLNVKDRSWESIVLNPAIKREVKANTVDFLRKGKRWAEYGIPQKRGVLLAGEPGTGKTIICKALMSEVDGITCITTNAYALSANEYITGLYEMAEDLSPCIVFIEDIDMIGLNREEYGYRSGPALISLLNVLDGVEDKQEIITVATTNNVETLDRAISQRPSRFDRVITISLPSIEERKELTNLLCQKIPIDEPIRDYIAQKTERCTPAQLQEVIYSLAIEHPVESIGVLSPYLEISKEKVDHAISKVNGRNRCHLGFDIENNHNGHNVAELNQTAVMKSD
ncbi:MAG: AAA family ATPase [Dehalococcoidales bacterium]|nr:AAA family ATPase [Dehalococcoidales bacterium]